MTFEQVMSLIGTIAGGVAVIAFVALVAFIALPLKRLGGVLEETTATVRRSTDELVPILQESQVTIREANAQLAKVDTITTHVADTTNNVSSLVSLTAATVGSPLVKIAGFSAGARAALASLHGPRRTRFRARKH